MGEKIDSSSEAIRETIKSMVGKNVLFVPEGENEKNVFRNKIGKVLGYLERPQFDNGLAVNIQFENGTIMRASLAEVTVQGDTE